MVPENSPADICVGWNLCESHAEQKARCTNYSRNWNAKNKAVTEIDKASEMPESGEPWRKDFIQAPWSQSFCLPRHLVEPLETSCAEFEDAVEALSILSTE
jgi:hypothetical protein